MADNRPRVTSAREAIEGMYIAFEEFDRLVGKRFTVWYGLNIFQMYNVLKNFGLSYSFTCILKPYILYSFRVFSFADDAYVMRITLVGG